MALPIAAPPGHHVDVAFHEVQRPGQFARRRLLRSYRYAVHGAPRRVEEQLSRIGHPEYPRRQTAEGITEWLDGLANLNRLLVSWRCLTRNEADADIAPLLTRRRRALDAAEE